MYTPEKCIAVDESLMPYKGKLGFKQYIPTEIFLYSYTLASIFMNCVNPTVATSGTWLFNQVKTLC